MSTPMIVAQMTDFHVVAPGRRCYEHVDTNAMLRRAVDHVNALDPRPHVVIGTGDLVDHGRPEEYAELREILTGLNVPAYLIPGNHDDRSAFLKAFGDQGYLPGAGSRFAHFVVDVWPLRLIGLDTTVPSRHHGEMCEERLSWLDARLAERPEAPTLVFMHHPPFRTGIEWMDGSGVQGGRAMARVIERHPQVVRVACGHVHRPIHVAWGGTIASVAPGTAHQVDLALDGVRTFEFVMEPPCVQLHVWRPPLGLVSHLSYVGTGQQPFRPQLELPEGVTWERVLESIAASYERMRRDEYGT